MDKPSIEPRRKSHIDQGELYFWTATINKWQRLLEKDEYKNVIIDSLQFLTDENKVDVYAFIIMPNHIHGIIVISDVGARHASPLQKYPPPPETSKSVQPAGAQKRSVGAIVGSFKSAATKRINELRRTPGFPVWQRNYFEHVIRSEESLNKIREYIALNPIQWETDPENLSVQANSTPLEKSHFLRG